MTRRRDTERAPSAVLSNLLSLDARHRRKRKASTEVTGGIDVRDVGAQVHINGHIPVI